MGSIPSSCPHPAPPPRPRLAFLLPPMWCPAGTNDNHRLLPLQVQQHLEVEDGLRGTNGKMLAVLLENPRFNTLEAGQVSS